MDHRGHVFGHGRFGAHRQSHWIYQTGPSPYAKEPDLGLGRSVRICGSGFRGGEQYARGGGDDPCICAIGQNFEHSCQQASDPLILCGDFGRNFNFDRHLDQSPGRWGCAGQWAGGVFDFRSDAFGGNIGALGHDLSAFYRPAIAAQAREFGHATLRSAKNEIFYGSGDPARVESDWAGGCGRAVVQTSRGAAGGCAAR